MSPKGFVALLVVGLCATQIVHARHVRALFDSPQTALGGILSRAQNVGSSSVGGLVGGAAGAAGNIAGLVKDIQSNAQKIIQSGQAEVGKQVNQVGSFFSGVIDNGLGLVGLPKLDLWEKIIEAQTAVIQRLPVKNAAALLDVAELAKQAAAGANALAKIANSAVNVLAQGAGNVGEAADGAAGAAGAVGEVAGGATGVFGEVAGGVPGIFGEVAGGATDAFGEVAGGATGVVGNIASRVKDIQRNAASIIQRGQDEVEKQVNSVGSFFSGIIDNGLSLVGLPKLDLWTKIVEAQTAVIQRLPVKNAGAALDDVAKLAKDAASGAATLAKIANSAVNVLAQATGAVGGVTGGAAGAVGEAAEGAAGAVGDVAGGAAGTFSFGEI